MPVEAVGAAALAVLTLWLVLQPLLVARRRPDRQQPAAEPPDPEETPKGLALAALKEIEFDRETGKLSDADYHLLKSKYTAQAVEALRAEEARGTSDVVEAIIAARVRTLRSADTATPPDGSPSHAAASHAAAAQPAPVCTSCGPRPEPDAVFCSTCGRRLESAVCACCHTPLAAGSRFCEACGTQVAV